MSAASLRDTNPKCHVQSVILGDQCDPTVEITFGKVKILVVKRIKCGQVAPLCFAPTSPNTMLLLWCELHYGIILFISLPSPTFITFLTIYRRSGVFRPLNFRV